MSGEQRTPRVSRADVERVIRRDFATSDYLRVLSVLNEGITENANQLSARVDLAVLKLARGDVKELRRNVAAARQDYRDVLSAAEYPTASARGSTLSSLSDKERQSIYDSDWEQYQKWLEHE